MKNTAKFYGKFIRCIIPAVLSYTLSAVYSVVDGFFVGNSVGDVGLSAINMVYPLVALMQAVGTGVGMGCAIRYSILSTQGRSREAKDYLGCMFCLSVLASILLTVLLLVSGKPLLHLLGATGEMFDLGWQYLQIMSFGALFQVFATGVIPLIRNSNGHLFAMITMVTGFAMNILLDYLLVWVYPGGIGGSAVATVASQGLTMVLGLIYLAKKRLVVWRFHITKLGEYCANIFRIAISPFGICMLPNLFLVLVNRFSMEYGGTQAVACYACISYVIYIGYLMVQGVGDGSQPLLSQYYARQDRAALHKGRRLAFGVALLLGGICAVLLFLLRYRVGGFLGSSHEVNQAVGDCFPIFLSAFPFIAISRVAVSYFYATDHSRFSYIVTYAEPILLLIALLILPPFWGQTGVWWSIALAQSLPAAIAFVQLLIEKRQVAHTAQTA